MHVHCSVITMHCRRLHPWELLLLLCSVLASWTHGSAQSQPEDAACDDSFSFFNASTAAGITHCKRLWTLGAEFGWRYTPSNRTANATLDVVFRAKPAAPGGWVAWGVNPGPRPHMVGTRALVAFSRANGTMAVYAYNVTVDPKKGCKLKPSEVEVKVVAKRAELDGATGDITMWATLGLPPEYNTSRLNHVWQVGPRVVGDVPKKHFRRMENFDSVETFNLTSGQDVGRDHRRVHLRHAHGILSVIGWGFLLPVGVIVARYFRNFPFQNIGWYWTHVGLQILAFLVGTCAWAIGLSLINDNIHFRTFMAHRIIGIFVFSLATLQMMALWLKPKDKDKQRKYWNIYHHLVGFLLVVLIVINIFKGFTILRPPIKWRWIYIAILGTLCCIALALEVTIWVKFSMKLCKDKTNSQQPSQRKDKESINQNNCLTSLFKF